jgi:hypothetical protein
LLVLLDSRRTTAARACAPPRAAGVLIVLAVFIVMPFRHDLTTAMELSRLEHELAQQEQSQEQPAAGAAVVGGDNFFDVFVGGPGGLVDQALLEGEQGDAIGSGPYGFSPPEEGFVLATGDAHRDTDWGAAAAGGAAAAAGDGQCPLHHATAGHSIRQHSY